MQATSPIFILPVELLQYTMRFLDPRSAASFSLTSRGIYYSVGKGHLNDYLSIHTDVERQVRAVRRIKFDIIERAFSSHWYCAWCEKFHAHDFEGGPTTFNRQIKRRCQEYNGYLHDEKNYVLCHHHVYLAMNRQLWGQDYGLALSAFNHSAHAKRTIGSWMYKIPATTFLQCEARIVDGKFILHAMYTLSLSPSPRSLNRLKTWSLREVLASSLPQIVSGHRDCNGLHTGMAKMLAERLNSTSHDNPVHSCEECATDFTILSLVEEKRTIWIEVWRDLGTGRNPFDSSWRAHGANGEKGKGFRGKTGPAMPGLIKEAFEGERVQDNMGGLKPLLSEWNVAKPRDMEVLQGFTAIRARCEELKRDIEQLEKQCYRVRRKLWEANS